MDTKEKESASGQIEETICETEEKSVKSQKTLIICLVAGVVIILLALAAFLFVYFNGWFENDVIADDPEQKPSVLMFLANAEDSSVGDLYFKQKDGDKNKLASDVIRGEYVILSSNDVLYVNNSKELHIYKYGAEDEKISSDVVNGSCVLSANENALLYVCSDGQEDESYELYIRYSDGEKEKISGNLDYYATDTYSLSPDGDAVCYLDKDGMFYEWTKEQGKKKIASGVVSFRGFGEAYSYMTEYDESQKKSYTYLKLANDTDAQKVDYNGDVEFSENGLLCAYLSECTYRDDKYIGELYIYAKGISPLKIGSDVVKFELSEDSSLIYFMDVDGNVYVKRLPEIADKNSYNSEKFREEAANNEKSVMCKDAEKFYVSPNGLNLAFIDKDANLYLSYNLGEKVKAAIDVTRAEVTDLRLVYLTGENKLYLNSRIDETENIKDNNNLIALEVEEFAMSAQGRYIAFCDNEDVNICCDGQKPEIISEKNSEYDTITFKNTEIYKNILKLADMIGKYKNDELGYLFEIKEDSNISWYYDGNENNSKLDIAYPMDRFSSSVYLTPFDERFTFHTFYKYTDKKQIGCGEEKYDLTLLTDEEFNSEIELQKSLEQQKQKEAERKAALENRIKEMNNRGRHYESSGINVSPQTPLYSYAGYDYLLSDVHYAVEGRESVCSYQVSDDGGTLWLQLYDEYDGSKVWVVAP